MTPKSSPPIDDGGDTPLFSFLGYFQIRNTEYKIQRIENETIKIKTKIQNAKNAKRNKYKLIIESINIKIL